MRIQSICMSSRFVNEKKNVTLFVTESSVDLYMKTIVRKN